MSNVRVLQEVSAEYYHEVQRLRAVNAVLQKALEAWKALDDEPFHFEDQRYIDLVERARALTRAALAKACPEVTRRGEKT